MDTMPIACIRIGERPRKDMGDINALAESIRQQGLLHPPAVTPDGTLIAGHRRILACQQLGMPEIEVRVIEVGNLLTAERDENAIRKAFTPSEAVAIARAIEAQLKAAGRQRKSEAAKRRWARAKGQEVIAHDSCSITPALSRSAAAVVGMADQRYRQAKEVVEAAEQDSEQFGDIVERMDATGKVLSAHTELRRRRDALPARHAVHRHMRYRDPNKEVERALVVFRGLAIGVKDIDPKELDAACIAEWAGELKQHISTFNQFYRRLHHECVNRSVR